LDGTTGVKLGENLESISLTKGSEPGHDYEFQGARSAIAPRRSICNGVVFSRPQIAVELKTKL